MTPRSRRTRVIATAVVLAGAACASDPPYDPFRMPAREIRARVDTVALAPLVVALDVDDVARVRALVEPRAVAMLEQGGFAVVPPAEWEQRWLAIAQAVGPIWDAKTGERDEKRYEAASSALQHELALERGVDAIVRLFVHLERVDATLPATTLCGTAHQVYWPRKPLPSLVRATVAIGACLGVLVTDMDARELYSIRNGVEFVDTYALQTHARRAPDQRLRDAASIEAVLDEILGPLAARPN